MVFASRYRLGVLLGRRKESMKYDIQKYLDQARTVYANLANTQDLFCGCNSYWKVGNVFDTMTDFLLVSDDSPGTIAADVYRIYKDLKGACWYDDYAWWGLASSKASDPSTTPFSVRPRRISRI